MGRNESERHSRVISSAERRLRAPRRSCRVEGNRQQAGPERLLDFSGVEAGGTSAQKNAEQERPSLAAESGSGAKTGRLRPDGTEPRGSPRGSQYRGRRARERAGGKGPCFDHAWTEVSARACWKQPITQRKKYDNSNAGYGSVPRCSVRPA